jgi:leader peptidase (prepilin peptidase) / N-methyltransferase
MSTLIVAAIFVLILGACLGSFANVVIVRLNEKSSLMGRSRCPSCRKTIRPRHLIPILSWFLLRGKCADCGKRIHWQYPFVEAAVALIALTAFLRHANEAASPQGVWMMLFELSIGFCLVVITAFDLRWQLVPLEFTLGSTVVLGVSSVLLGTTWQSLLFGSMAAGIPLALIVLVSRGRAMGEGDPIVGLLLGTILGFPLAIAGLFLSFILGGSVAASLLIQGKVKRTTHIPFVPFLAAGTLLAMWWQVPLEAYLKYGLF